MRSIHLLALGFTLSLTTFACAASTDSSSDPSSAESSEEQDLVKAGKACGDDVAIRKKCAKGLTCVYPTSGPISEHTPGICKAVSHAGGLCGDDVAIQKVCAAGLTCVFPTSGPISEHTPGTCQKRALEGDDCKSFGNPSLPLCAPGLTCEPGPIPDTAHCVK